jgi:hypothetical protein
MLNFIKGFLACIFIVGMVIVIPLIYYIITEFIN